MMELIIVLLSILVLLKITNLVIELKQRKEDNSEVEEPEDKLLLYQKVVGVVYPEFSVKLGKVDGVPSYIDIYRNSTDNTYCEWDYEDFNRDSIIKEITKDIESFTISEEHKRRYYRLYYLLSTVL